ncbi:MAG: NTP transferase domain-containing protein, partial [Actinomycetota bacterium]
IGGDTPGLSAVTIADRFPGEGPVGGLSTALGADLLRDAAGVFVLACDLPWIDVAVLHTLAGVDRRSCDVVVASTDRPQPLCALWLPSARVIVDEAFAQGERAMWRVLERCRVTEVDIEQAWRLDDVDTPDDLARSTSRSTTRSVNRSADRPADGAGPER